MRIQSFSFVFIFLSALSALAGPTEELCHRLKKGDRLTSEDITAYKAKGADFLQVVPVFDCWSRPKRPSSPFLLLARRSDSAALLQAMIDNGLDIHTIDWDPYFRKAHRHSDHDVFLALERLVPVFLKNNLSIRRISRLVGEIYPKSHYTKGFPNEIAEQFAAGEKVRQELIEKITNGEAISEKDIEAYDRRLAFEGDASEVLDAAFAHWESAQGIFTHLIKRVRPRSLHCLYNMKKELARAVIEQVMRCHGYDRSMWLQMRHALRKRDVDLTALMSSCQLKDRITMAIDSENERWLSEVMAELKGAPLPQEIHEFALSEGKPEALVRMVYSSFERASAAMRYLEGKRLTASPVALLIQQLCFEHLRNANAPQTGIKWVPIANLNAITIPPTAMSVMPYNGGRLAERLSEEAARDVFASSWRAGNPSAAQMPEMSEEDARLARGVATRYGALVTSLLSLVDARQLPKALEIALEQPEWKQLLLKVIKTFQQAAEAMKLLEQTNEKEKRAFIQGLALELFAREKVQFGWLPVTSLWTFYGQLRELRPEPVQLQPSVTIEEVENMAAQAARANQTDAEGGRRAILPTHSPLSSSSSYYSSSK